MLNKKPIWRKWGPYLSERQWGTVREDYSENGDAWDYLTHEQSRSRAYRWGEDGIAGISDDQQILCFAIALWNGQDPILKERLFGLTSKEGNHGEDVKEYYFYLDNVPDHSYMKYLYKYPHQRFPYENLVEENRKRSRLDPEYELLDTGIFDQDKYFDVFVEYAKADAEDILIQITVANRGLDAQLHLLPTLWFRNTWSWGLDVEKPQMSLENGAIKAGDYWLTFDQAEAVLFTENNTNNEKLFGVPNTSAFVKDGIHEAIVNGNKNCVNPENKGTKGAIHYLLNIGAQKTAILKLRLSKERNKISFDKIFAKRKKEADDFYQQITPGSISEDMRNVQRQAFAGLLWNKQLYHYNVDRWLKGDPNGPKPPEGHKARNHKWWHFDSFEVLSMPDKWEYPWFAAWDLAFHSVTFALIDPEFAKRQLLFLTEVWTMHPAGQLPAYEWNFSDVNPPVQAWAALRIYQIEGKKDRDFLERIFQKLTLNFTWWAAQKDQGNRNIFEGGFLGLDNIGPFDRSKMAPNGGMLEEPDATGWMGMYCLNLLEIALELSVKNPIYEDMVIKFFEHFIDIADAINDIGGYTEGLWDHEKGFYYSIMTSLHGDSVQLDYDSLIGIIPLFAISIIHPTSMKFKQEFEWVLKQWKERVDHIIDVSKMKEKKVLLSIASAKKLKRILEKVLDEKQFLSPFGVRSVSRALADKPYILQVNGKEFRLDYEPAESNTALFGGNSNWRGPILFPLNYLLIESLKRYALFLGDDFKIGQKTLNEIAKDLSNRLINIFLKDEKGRRPVYGGIEKFQTDPHWKDYILFHEYFHGDNGSGLGSSNQTGWTALVAKLIHEIGT
jgi:hypothetical protein